MATIGSSSSPNLSTQLAGAGGLPPDEATSLNPVLSDSAIQGDIQTDKVDLSNLPDVTDVPDTSLDSSVQKDSVVATSAALPDTDTMLGILIQQIVTMFEAIMDTLANIGNKQADTEDAENTTQADTDGEQASNDGNACSSQCRDVEQGDRKSSKRRAAFDQMDQDGNNSLSWEEFRDSSHPGRGRGRGLGLGRGRGDK